ncbi:MAG TPA: hypothetical protein VMW50_13945, partial [Dehalococcoidia bacterium]|nr:hypothetical protein [Dehalococcoidia bacterium]
ICFPTGSDLLDTLVGGGESLGYPAGRIINFVGDKSSGKTFLACEVIAAAYYKFKNKLKWVYDDSESGFSFDTKKLYGVEIMPINRKDRIKSPTVEDAYCNVRKFFEDLPDDEFGIYCIDSLDALKDKEGKKIADEHYKKFNARSTAAQLKEEKEKGSYRMGKPKYLSEEFFPNLADLIERKNGLLIIVSQVRCNIDPFSFEKYTRAGGKAMDFYAHTVLWLANINKIKRKDRAVGVTIKAKNNKSKTPRPYREMFLVILFDYGIDNITTNIDFLFDFRTNTGLVEKNATASWNTSNEYTMAQLKQFLIDNNKENYYRKNINTKLKHEELMNWFKQEGNEKLFAKLEKTYSEKMSRNDLINYIEKNNLQKELAERAVEKWEQIEASIRTNRPPKYQ